MKHFSGKIMAWYDQHKRDLPWRSTNDPYLIWLSEIILQQTRVEQGRSYYHKFADAFPTIKHLAKADSDKVMKLWQGLGYYSRARNLHAAAKTVADKYKGQFPSSYEDILELKGVGEYTAAAVASIAFGLPHAVVDGNVYRVLSRVFGIKTPIDSLAGKKEFYKLANELLDKKHPARFNQAVMELGALQCKPVNPDCGICPLNTMCFASAKKMVAEFPVKEKKTKVRDRYFNYVVWNHKGTVAINKRIGKDIWTSLYDFPLIEADRELTETKLFGSQEWKKLTGKTKYTVRSVSPFHKHILSHQRIYARFIELECDKPLAAGQIIKRKEIHKYAVPRLIENYINVFKC
ncbi:MAG: A/G-specific adenine glycosylase [Bacteroidia bacterium]